MPNSIYYQKFLENHDKMMDTYRDNKFVGIRPVVTLICSKQNIPAMILNDVDTYDLDKSMDLMVHTIDLFVKGYKEKKYIGSQSENGNIFGLSYMVTFRFKKKENGVVPFILVDIFHSIDNETAYLLEYFEEIEFGKEIKFNHLNIDISEMKFPFENGKLPKFLANNPF